MAFSARAGFKKSKKNAKRKVKRLGKVETQKGLTRAHRSGQNVENSNSEKRKSKSQLTAASLLNKNIT